MEGSCLKSDGKATRSTKRNPFAELGEGMTALVEALKGKRILRTDVECKATIHTMCAGPDFPNMR